MYSFENDYSEGAHPRILSALIKTNTEQTTGYGEDVYTQNAANAIKQVMQFFDCDIHFLSGGTQTNLIALSAFLKPYEAVLSANTGHIHVHETGAIEAAGHKILTIDTPDGKITPALLQTVLDIHTDEHMVKPRLVYISNTTELGTTYTKSELESLHTYCRSNDLYLYVDGARLGSALCTEYNDITLHDLCRLSDAFYIGGTKNGALFGEALVLINPIFKKDFRYSMKQKGGLLAKGRILGIQFLELFADSLFFELAKHANRMADYLRTGIQKTGFPFLSASNSNQIFPILPDSLISELQKKYRFYIWSKTGADNSCIRLVTSWATKEEAVIDFIKTIEMYVSR